MSSVSAQEGDGYLEARGLVKWFDPVKGFGFVLIEACDDPQLVGNDALLHVSVVRRSGGATPGEGDSLSITVERGERGLQVVHISELFKVERPVPEDIEQFAHVIVRWFNRSKGYGFVSLVDQDGNDLDDGEDVFLHIATMRRAGIEFVDEGQFLRARIENGAKGAIVTEVYAG